MNQFNCKYLPIVKEEKKSHHSTNNFDAIGINKILYPCVVLDGLEIKLQTIVAPSFENTLLSPVCRFHLIQEISTRVLCIRPLKNWRVHFHIGIMSVTKVSYEFTHLELFTLNNWHLESISSVNSPYVFSPSGFMKKIEKINHFLCLSFSNEILALSSIYLFISICIYGDLN